MSDLANNEKISVDDRNVELLKTLNLVVSENDADEMTKDDWSEHSDLCDVELEQLNDIQEKDPALNNSEIIRKKQAAIEYLQNNYSIYMTEPSKVENRKNRKIDDFDITKLKNSRTKASVNLHDNSSKAFNVYNFDTSEKKAFK